MTDMQIKRIRRNGLGEMGRMVYKVKCLQCRFKKYYSNMGTAYIDKDKHHVQEGHLVIVFEVNLNDKDEKWQNRKLITK